MNTLTNLDTTLVDTEVQRFQPSFSEIETTLRRLRSDNILVRTKQTVDKTSYREIPEFTYQATILEKGLFWKKTPLASLTVKMSLYEGKILAESATLDCLNSSVELVIRNYVKDHKELFDKVNCARYTFNTAGKRE